MTALYHTDGKRRICLAPEISIAEAMCLGLHALELNGAAVLIETPTRRLARGPSDKWVWLNPGNSSKPRGTWSDVWRAAQ